MKGLAVTIILILVIVILIVQLYTIRLIITTADKPLDVKSDFTDFLTSLDIDGNDEEKADKSELINNYSKVRGIYK